jgi:hypothetical protein
MLGSGTESFQTPQNPPEFIISESRAHLTLSSSTSNNTPILKLATTELQNNSAIRNPSVDVLVSTESDDKRKSGEGSKSSENVKNSSVPTQLSTPKSAKQRKSKPKEAQGDKADLNTKYVQPNPMTIRSTVSVPMRPTFLPHALSHIPVPPPPSRFSGPTPNTLTLFKTESIDLSPSASLASANTKTATNKGKSIIKFDEAERTQKMLEERPAFLQFTPISNFSLQIHEKSSPSLTTSTASVIVKEPSELGTSKGLNVPIKEDDESCHSLFCEEEIPGSPPDMGDPDLPVFSSCPPIVPLSIATQKDLKDCSATVYPEIPEKQPGSYLTDLTCSEEMKSENELSSSISKSFSSTNLEQVEETVPPELSMANNSQKCPASDAPLTCELNTVDNTPPVTPDSTTSTDSPVVVGGRISPFSIEEPKSKEPSDSEGGEGPDAKTLDEVPGPAGPDGKSLAIDYPELVRKSKSTENKKLGSLSPPLKRRRISRRKSPDDKVKLYTSRGGRVCTSRRIANSGSDGDSGRMPPPAPLYPLIRPPRSSKWSFIPDLSDTMVGEERIAIITSSMQELKEVYLTMKSNLVAVEKRRKRLKKREREREREKEKAAEVKNPEPEPHQGSLDA